MAADGISEGHIDVSAYAMLEVNNVAHATWSVILAYPGTWYSWKTTRIREFYVFIMDYRFAEESK